jgi:hypothetical protein
VDNFAGDGKADLMGYHPSNGTLWVFKNAGSRFSAEKWYGEGVGEGKNLDPPDRWTFLAGDFNGNSKPDLVGYHPSTGSLWVFRNIGSRFSVEKWYGKNVGEGKDLSPRDSWTFLAGNFTGNSKQDLVGYHPLNGSLWVFRNATSHFSPGKWKENLSPPDSWVFLAGDFAGDSKQDLVGYHPSNGTLTVATNTGSEFTTERWADLTSASTWTFFAHDFSGAGKDDVLGYFPSMARSGPGSTPVLEDWKAMRGRFPPHPGKRSISESQAVEPAGPRFSGTRRPRRESEASRWAAGTSSPSNNQRWISRGGTEPGGTPHSA